MADEDVVDEPAEEAQEPKTKGLYKGEVKTVAELAEGFKGFIALQPVERKYQLSEHAKFTLPPSFVLTKFQKVAWNGHYYAHYYRPKTKERTYREVPGDMKFNLLTGRQGEQLREAFVTDLKSDLGNIGRRQACTVGADPEIFAVDKKGVIVPAWTYLPGKDAPQTYKGTYSGAVYWDGFQAEFSTAGTQTCLLQFSDNIHDGLKAVHVAAKKAKAALTLDSVLPVDPDFLSKESEEHVQFGCAPSFNLYGLKGNAEHGRNVPYRFAGGHIHLGITGYGPDGGQWPQSSIDAIVRGLDRVVGLGAVSLFAKQDNPIRRQFYGQPGEYRLPKHGLEYRVLSNAWLAHPLIMNMVYDLTRAVVGCAAEGLIGAWQSDDAETIEIIMNHDVTRAREVLARNRELFVQLYRVVGGTYVNYGDAADIAYRVWAEGMESAIKDPKDIVGNWGLESGWNGHGEKSGANFFSAYSTLRGGKRV